MPNKRVERARLTRSVSEDFAGASRDNIGSVPRLRFDIVKDGTPPAENEIRQSRSHCRERKEEVP